MIYKWLKMAMDFIVESQLRVRCILDQQDLVKQKQSGAEKAVELHISTSTPDNMLQSGEDMVTF